MQRKSWPRFFSAHAGRAVRWRCVALSTGGSAELPRKLVVISGSSSWTEQVGREVLQAMGSQAASSGQTFKSLVAHDFRADKPPPASEWMGQELDAALLSVQRLNFLDTFGAVCGALRGGGVLLLCTPEMAGWKASSSAARQWCREIETLASGHYAEWSRFISQESGLLLRNLN